MLQQGKMFFLDTAQKFVIDLWLLGFSCLLLCFHTCVTDLSGFLSCFVTPALFCDPSGIRPRLQHGAGVSEDGVSVQICDLLQGHSSAEGSGGRAGQEVQGGSYAGYRRWSQ